MESINKGSATREVATLAGGCFWCLDGSFATCGGSRRLGVFFTIHDPMTLNRQGGDVGTQYRSAIFYNSPEQRTTAEQVIRELQGEGLWDDSVVTELTPFTNYYRAENYHQDYFNRNPYQGYCAAVIAPKVAKFRSKYLERLAR